MHLVDLPRGAHPVRHRSDQVRADVEQGAAPSSRIESVVALRNAIERELCRHTSDRTQRAGADQLVQTACSWMPLVPGRLDQQTVGRARCLESDATLSRVHGERLLAEDVFPGFECSQDPVEVHVVGQRDVDRVDVIIGDDLLVVGRADPGRLKRGSPSAVSCRRRLKDGRGTGVDGRCEGFGGDKAGTDEAPADWWRAGSAHASPSTRTGAPLSRADALAASMTATTRRDCSADTVMGHPYRTSSTNCR